MNILILSYFNQAYKSLGIYGFSFLFLLAFYQNFLKNKKSFDNDNHY